VVAQVDDQHSIAGIHDYSLFAAHPIDSVKANSSWLHGEACQHTTDKVKVCFASEINVHDFLIISRRSLQNMFCGSTLDSCGAKDKNVLNACG
jgi:hypothetical protein